MPLGFGRKPTGRPGEWFYCVKHGKVEEGPECPAKDRLGPYASREEAGRALETAAERNREWQTDPRWHDDQAAQPDGRPTQPDGRPTEQGDRPTEQGEGGK